MNVKSIIAALPTLKPDELKMVRDAVGHLLNDEASLSATTRPTGDLFNAVQANLAAIGIQQRMNYEAFTKTKQFKAWESGVKEVEAFVEKYFPESNTKIKRTALLRMLVRLLIEHMKENQIPISMGTVATNIRRVPEAFDRAFPGYLEAGLAHLVLKYQLNSKN